MANGDTSPSRPGQSNLSGSALALFLKVFSGEVLATFEEMNVMAPLVSSRTIASGKSAQFPVLGRASAFYHQSGQNIADAGNSLLSLIPAAERVINIDNMLASAVVIDDLDEAMAHFEVRGPYARELGRAIAKRVDQLSLNTVILAARASATITGLNGGSVISTANMGTDGTVIAASLFTAAQKFDEKDVPKENRWAVISPAMLYALIQNPTTSTAGTSPTVSIASSGYPLLNRELSPGNGNYAKATMYECAGIRLLTSNHIPSTNITSGDAFFGTGAGGASANGNVYYGDFSKTKGVVFHTDAVGMVKLRDLRVSAAEKLELLGTLTVARLAMGMGILRPECSVELAIP